MRRLKCEFLVVGGGPAGSTTAYKLAKEGAKVLVVDFKRKIGTPVQCAEFVPIQLYHQFKEFFDKEAIAQRVNKMVHFTPWGEVVSMESTGLVLNREIRAELRLKEGLAYGEGKVVFEDGRNVVEGVGWQVEFKPTRVIINQAKVRLQ